MKLHSESLHQRIADLLKQRRKFVVATIIDVKGSCPQKPGAKMIVHPDGTFESTIGGGTFEAEVLHDARANMISPVWREYHLTKNELGMYCQGLVKVFLEPYIPKPQIVIFGAGHVGQSLSKMASATGLFHVVVMDDRQEFANREKHPDADEVIHTDRNYETGMPVLDDQTFVVIVTRCHATDQLLIKKMAGASVAYTGVIGSEAKVRQFFKELQDEGLSLSYLESLHAPIGLPIGGKDPAEVAVSILAEIIQVKNRMGEQQSRVLEIKSHS